MCLSLHLPVRYLLLLGGFLCLNGCWEECHADTGRGLRSQPKPAVSKIVQVSRPATPARDDLPLPVAEVLSFPETAILAPSAGEIAQRKALIAVFRGLVGVKEHPLGSNRGPEVDAFNRAAKTLLGSPWCASVRVWGLMQVGLPAHGNAYSPSWYRKAIVTRDPLPGDFCLIWFPKLDGGRWGHTIAVIESVRYRGNRPYELVTLEGNTNAQGSREGDQFARRIRPFDTVLCLRFEGT